MAEYVFVPTGARVFSSSELGAPLWRRVEEPKPKAKAKTRRSPAPKKE